MDALPHQLRVAGDLALVVVPGRAPLCLRCRGKGHIRRECRVPRCALCRRFGHEESQCVRTYATVTGPVENEDASEHLMDATESEDAADGAGGPPLPEALPPHSAEDRNGIRSVVENRPLPQARAAGDVSAAEDVSMTHSSVPVATPNKEPEDWSGDEARSSGAVAKRAREEGVFKGLNTSAVLPEEPPPKAASVRRVSFKPKPNIPTERRPTATSPP